MTNQTDHDRVEHNMTTHPLSEGDVAVVEAVREVFKAAAHYVVEVCPPSRERSLALTDLESGLMWAVASIARAM